MKGLFIPEITAKMFRNGCLESIEALMAEGEIYDIDYSPWIPVSERLPESNDIVLVTLNDSHVTKASYFNQHWVYHAGDVFKSNYPVAWMPLPKPYRGEI